MERLTRNELVAVIGGLLLGGGLFAPWYSSVSRLASVAGSAFQRRSTASWCGWQDRAC